MEDCIFCKIIKKGAVAFCNSPSLPYIQLIENTTELIPSNELELINPAASPTRYIPAPPQRKSLRRLGEHTVQASVNIGSPSGVPIKSSRRAFCFSKFSLPPTISNAPPNMISSSLWMLQEQLSLVSGSKMQE